MNANSSAARPDMKNHRWTRMDTDEVGDTTAVRVGGVGMSNNNHAKMRRRKGTANGRG